MTHVNDVLKEASSLQGGPDFFPRLGHETAADMVWRRGFNESCLLWVVIGRALFPPELTGASPESLGQTISWEGRAGARIKRMAGDSHHAGPCVACKTNATGKYYEVFYLEVRTHLDTCWI